jgi:hypothetical protein
LFEKKDRQYAKSYLEEMFKYEKFQEEIRQGIHGVQVQRAACAHLDDHLSELVAEVDKDIRSQNSQQRTERHAVETKLEKLTQSCNAEVRGLMREEQETRESSNEYTEEVTNEICYLYKDLESSRNYRIAKSEKLQEVVTQKLDEIQVAIDAEKSIREESTHTLLELFGQMGNKMQKEIDEVKIQRQESTNRLIQLMEVVLPHLQEARLNQVKLVNEKLEDQKAAVALATFAAEKFQKRQSMAPRKSLFGNGLDRAKLVEAANLANMASAAADADSDPESPRSSGRYMSAGNAQ